MGSIPLSLASIAVGATLGAWLRWGFSLWLNARLPMLPLGTLAANLVGAYLIGMAVGFFNDWPHLSPEWRLLAITGFLGGLTTFSAFTAEGANLLLDKPALALGHAAVHVLGCLLAFFIASTESTSPRSEGKVLEREKKRRDIEEEKKKKENTAKEGAEKKIKR